MIKQKVILITGGSSGIGKTCANYFSYKDYKVYGTSRNPENLNLNHNFNLIPLEVTNTSSITNAVNKVINNDGRIDILINNAGIGLLGAVEDTTIEEAEMVFKTNFFGVMKVCQEVLPIMRKQQSGLIINIGSLGGLMGLPYRSAYCASKFALEGLTEALRMEVAPFGIKVVMVEPGDINTEINANRNTAANAQINTTYKTNFEIVKKIIHQEVENGCSPEVIAKLVEQIINTPSPKIRYKAGLFKQKIAIPVKNILPSKIFERILKKHYKIKK